MEQEPVVIVDAEGVEHEFPPGMDPKRAAEIVRSKAGQAQTLTADRPQHDRRAPQTNLSDDPTQEEPSFFTRLGGALEGSANLQGDSKLGTLGNILGLILPSKMMSGAGAERGMAAAGRGVERTGDITLAAGQKLKGPSLMAATADVMNGGDMMRPLAIAATPPILRGAGRATSAIGRGMQRERILTKPPVRKVIGEVAEEVGSALPEGVQEGAFTEIPKPGLTPAASTQLGPSDLETQMMGMADEASAPPASTPLQQAPEPKSVIDYTSPEMPQDIPDDELAQRILWNTEDAPATADAMRSAPLGKPRVKAWKEGHGPSDELIGEVRDAEGSKSAALRLAIPVSEVKTRAPRMNPRALPTDARNRIEEAMAGMTPEEKLAYLESAPNDISELFIQTHLKP
jgi:hypothetical protein